MKRDLENEEDIKLLVDTFYNAVNQDELLAPIFNGHAKVVWGHHLPIMYNFWSTVLLGSMTYKGYPFQKHMSLPITQLHFSRWINLFTNTIDVLFEGTKAAEAKQKASSIALVFQMKMGLIDSSVKHPIA